MITCFASMYYLNLKSAAFCLISRWEAGKPVPCKASNARFLSFLFHFFSLTVHNPALPPPDISALPDIFFLFLFVLIFYFFTFWLYFNIKLQQMPKSRCHVLFVCEGKIRNSVITPLELCKNLGPKIYPGDLSSIH